MSALVPPAVIGIVGGGQLGRMLAQAAQRHGYRTAVLTGGLEETPAGAVADIEIAARFDDTAAVQRLVACADVITWELEDVDLGVADAAADAGIPVRPRRQVLAAAADRAAEKRALMAADVPVAPYREAAGPSELAASLGALHGPVIVKTARGGYDGKGQVRMSAAEPAPERAASAAEVFRRLGSVRLIVEQEVPFDREVSVVVARSATGAIADHGVMENIHVDGILDLTTVPARLPQEVAATAVGIAGHLAHHLDLVGVLCVEMFVVGAELVVNEIAPRPHNSGHCTIEAAATSQFTQQLRAVCGLPLGDGTCRPAAMAQLLGDLWAGGEPPWSEVLTDPGVHLHLYGKRDPRPGRKMGHLTCVDATPELALKRVLTARDRLAS
ncbi:MAG: 5-(carboxyamino)imidazole ribonucleotide synthase [bacterium]|nr:5-(carboxyamino)imidazole ribonucleotide synthase [bacterium]